MLSRILSYVIAVAMFLSPLTVNAGLGDVLSSLADGAVANVNAPGRFQSQARTGANLGGFEMRVPGTKNAPTLVSFTPPRIDAGCSGVSAYFGGFSFISGREFEALLKNIASGVALGFVAHLALKTLCPQCEAVVQLMQRLNQIASMAAKDACKFGKHLAEEFGKWAAGDSAGKSADQNAKCGKAAETGADKGDVSDMWSGLEGLCTSLQTMNDTLQRDVIDKVRAWENAGASPSDVKLMKAAENLLLQKGNSTWTISGVFFPDTETESVRQRTMLLNLIGTTLYPDENGPGSCGGSIAGDRPAIPCAPQTKVEEVMELFMCGTSASALTGVSQNVIDACSKTIGWNKAQLENRMFYQCTEPEKCMNMVVVPYAQAGTLSGYVGIHFQVNRALREAVTRVASNRRLWDGTNTDRDGKTIVALIQSAPYPLYQAINAAAVYPAASGEILDSLTIVIGEQLAMSYFNEYLRIIGRANKGTGLTPEMLRSIQTAMETFTGRVDNLKSKLATNIAVQEGITQSIRSLNQAIQRQVMSEELFGANQFGKGLSSLVSNGTGRATPAP